MARSRQFRTGLPAILLVGALLLGPATRPAAALALATLPSSPTATATTTATPSVTTTPKASPTATATATASVIPPTVTAAAIMPTASVTPDSTATATAVAAVGTPAAPASTTPTVGPPDPPPTSTASPSPAPGMETTTPTAGPLASPTGTATASPTGTATASPTPAPVRITGITPAAVTNTAAVSVAVLGSGFIPGQVVTIGGRPLTNVQVLSPTQVVGMLSPGLCPGSAAAGVTPPGGVMVVGGQIAVQGVRSASFLGAMPSWSITLDGTDQQRQLLLAPIQIVDTTCSTGDWRVQVAVTASTEHGKDHPTLLPQALAVTLPGADRPTASLDLRHAAAGVITIPRPAGVTTAVVPVAMTVLVPAGSYAGQLTMPVAVTLLAGG